MATRASKSALDKSKSNVVGNPMVMEQFWSCKLDGDTKSHQWVIQPEVATEDDEDDEDFMNHTLFLRTCVLGDGAAEGESNVVMLKSEDHEEKETEGAIVHLVKGQGNPMATCDISINGKIGCTLTLSSGSGPVYLSGVYLQEYPREENLDQTHGLETDDETADELNETAETDGNDESVEDEDEDEDEDEEEEEEEEEEKPTKVKKNAVKRKASVTKGTKSKKMKKDDTEEEEDEDEAEDEAEEEEDEESDMEDEEENVKPSKKVTKKNVKDTKGAKTGKAKTPEVKKGKKGAKAK